jgi:hypothetical protein
MEIFPNQFSTCDKSTIHGVKSRSQQLRHETLHKNAARRKPAVAQYSQPRRQINNSVKVVTERLHPRPASP